MRPRGKLQLRRRRLDGRIDEDFVDSLGRYDQLEHCGACGVDCRTVHPHATELSCVELGPSYGCVALSCEEGFRLEGRGCLAVVDVSCLACERDADCSRFTTGARCVELGGSQRCVAPCDPAAGCPPGFGCQEGWCEPETGQCACTMASEGVSFACLLSSGPAVCAGRQLCEQGEVGPCLPLFAEQCNGEDDDCDGETDEDFLDEQGRYVTLEHCGGCDQPCAAPGPHLQPRCEVIEGEPRCLFDCEDQFVDLDGVRANGCECEKTVGTWPPRRLGVDADCDGETDDSDAFVFVASWGADRQAGTRAFPLRTIRAGMALAAQTSKTLVISGGTYHERIQVRAGVKAYGGYSPDFLERDVARYPTIVQPHDNLHGHPVLTCTNVRAPFVLGGVTLYGSDALEPGAGSTTVYLDRCTAAVELAEVTIVAGRGADGAAGADSSVNLSAWGLESLLELAGEDGRPGRQGIETSSPVCRSERVPGGRAGRRWCPATGALIDGGAGADSRCVDAGCRVGWPCGNSGCTDFMTGELCDWETMLALAVPNPPGAPGQGPDGGPGGASSFHAPTNRGTCHFCDDNPTLPRNGEAGQPGGAGADGLGGRGCQDELGVLDLSTGRWRAADGAAGEPGRDGGGGGGGSAGAGFDVILGRRRGLRRCAGWLWWRGRLRRLWGSPGVGRRGRRRVGGRGCPFASRDDSWSRPD